MKKNKKIKNVCLVTGGAGFLGSQFCKFFQKKNYQVLCIDNDKKKLKILDALKLENLTTYYCDITKHNHVEKLFKTINKTLFVNVLINAAAIDAIPFKKRNKIEKFPDIKSWDLELNTSLRGSFFMIKFFGEEMIKKKRGSIINIGSDLSVIAPNQKIYKSSYSNYIKPVTYTVIKHGLVGLTKYFSSLYGECNVRVNMVSPGPVKNTQSKKLLNEIEEMTPMARLGNPDNLFGLLFLLASDKSSYITGQNILVDGGKTII